MNMQNENISQAQQENTEASAEQSLTNQAAEGHFESLDMSEEINDSKSSIQALANVQINRPEAMMSIHVFDPVNVFITNEAKKAINRAHFKPLYFVEAYALHYSKNLFRELTRSNSSNKGQSVLDPLASQYKHTLSSGQVIVVHGKTVEIGGVLTRKLTICVTPINSTGASA